MACIRRKVVYKVGNKTYNKKSTAQRVAVKKGVNVCKQDRLSGLHPNTILFYRFK